MSRPCPDCERGLLPAPMRTGNSMRTDRHPHRLPAHIAARLTEAKERLNVTYRLLARVIGQTHGHLVNVFNAKAAPSVTTARRLIKVLPLDPVTADELMNVAMVPWEYPPGNG